MSEQFLNGKVTLHRGDCLDALRSLEENSLDACVTDPPYHLTSIVKRFGSPNAAECQFGKDGAYARASKGFMGKQWDGVEVPKLDAGLGHWLAGFADGEGCFTCRKQNSKGFCCEFIIHVRADDAKALRAIHEATGIGDIRGPTARGDGSAPMVKWIVSRQRDCAMLVQIFRAFPLRAKKARDFEIWASAVEEWIKHEPGTSWDDLASHSEMLSAVKAYGSSFHPSQLFHYRWAKLVYRALKPGGHLLAFCGTRTYHRLAAAVEDAGFEIRDQIGWCYGSGFPKSHNIGNGWGTALKPAWEPIVLARKPLSESSIAANVLKWGTGALNIDGCRVETDWSTDPTRRGWQGCNADSGEFGWKNGKAQGPNNQGRWPANLIHDGSEEVLEGFPETQSISGGVSSRGNNSTWSPSKGMNTPGREVPRTGHNDSGSAARFFYTAKADTDDRLGSKHPTVKPLDLIQYLVRLVCPVGGTVIDPFAGTGTTGEAAFCEGFQAVLIEREPEYQADIVKRMGLCLAGPDERRAKSVKQEGFSGLPLFEETK